MDGIEYIMMDIIIVAVELSKFKFFNDIILIMLMRCCKTFQSLTFQTKYLRNVGELTFQKCRIYYVAMLLNV